MCFIIAAYRYSPRLPDAPGRTGRGLRAEDLPAQLVAVVVPQAAVGDQAVVASRPRCEYLQENSSA